MASALSLGILFTAFADSKHPDGTVYADMNVARIIATAQEAVDSLQKPFEKVLAQSYTESTFRAEIALCSPEAFQKETELFLLSLGSRALNSEQKEAELELLRSFARTQKGPEWFVSRQTCYSSSMSYQVEAGGKDVRSMSSLFSSRHPISLDVSEGKTESLLRKIALIPQERLLLRLEGQVVRHFNGEQSMVTQVQLDPQKPFLGISSHDRSMMRLCFIANDLPIMAACATGVERVSRTINYGGRLTEQFVSVGSNQHPTPNRTREMQAIRTILSSYPKAIAEGLFHTMEADPINVDPREAASLRKLLESPIGTALLEVFQNYLGNSEKNKDL